jgi:short subunit dehydrogenase-like uncharacterized protein
MHHGEPVLAACVNNGTHYLDSTGEVPWIYDMVAKYDSLAKKNNTIIIPECGLDSVPADIMAYVLAREVRKRYNTACERAIMTLYDFKSGISGGTSLTMLELFKKYSLSHLGKSMHPYSLSPVNADQVVASPSGNFPYSLVGLQTIPELGGIQTTGLMASVDVCIAHRSWGLYQSSSDKSLQYGPKFRFNEYARAPNVFMGFAQKAALTSIAILLAIPVTRWFLEPLLKMVVPSPGSGPTKESMKDDFMHYRGVGSTEDGKKVLANLEVAHGGYVATAMTLSAAAKVILRGRLEDTEAGRLGGGILTPATLGDEYVKTLNEFGMKIRVDA